LEALKEATQQGLALKPQAILLTGDHGDHADQDGQNEALHDDHGRDIAFDPGRSAFTNSLDRARWWYSVNGVGGTGTT
jgi:hypothetical protein